MRVKLWGCIYESVFMRLYLGEYIYETKVMRVHAWQVYLWEFICESVCMRVYL